MTDEILTEQDEIKKLQNELERARVAYRTCMSIFVGTSVAILSGIIRNSSSLETELNKITATPGLTNNVAYLEINNGLRKKFGNGLRLYYYKGKYLPQTTIEELESEKARKQVESRLTAGEEK